MLFALVNNVAHMHILAIAANILDVRRVSHRKRAKTRGVFVAHKRKKYIHTYGDDSSYVYRYIRRVTRLTISCQTQMCEIALIRINSVIKIILLQPPIYRPSFWFSLWTRKLESKRRDKCAEIKLIINVNQKQFKFYEKVYTHILWHHLIHGRSKQK